MPQKSWSAKRERQDAHIKGSLFEQGRSLPVAQEIAARVVNKERAQHGESVKASPSSVNDMSSSRRGGPALVPGAGRPNAAAASQRGATARPKRALHHEQSPA